MDDKWKKRFVLTVTRLLNVTGTFQLGGVTVTATADQLNRNLSAASRVVVSTATVLALSITQHASRTLYVNTNSTVANTFSLPGATGSGERFTIVNNITQTQGSVVVQSAVTTDLMSGVAFMFASTTSGAEAFVTTATSKKVTFNITTTGGLGGDVVEAVDTALGVYTVRVFARGSGSLGTPFS